MISSLAFISSISENQSRIGNTHGSADAYRIYNTNPFRCEKIIDDIEGNFVSVIDSNLEGIDFIFIDFMEERYDAAELEDGNFITISEAFMDSYIKGLTVSRIIKAGTPEHYLVWRQKCTEFVKLIKKRYKNSQIILIKSRLATQYQMGREITDYPEKKAVEAQNLMIEQMENYFLEQMGSGVQIYSYPDRLYTEESFRMGMEPQYLGNSFYQKMKMRISTEFDCVAKWE